VTGVVGTHRLSVLCCLQRVVALADNVRIAHGAERVGAANEEASRRWHHHNANVVLTGLLETVKFNNFSRFF